MWYLTHYPGPGAVTRNCTVPTGKAILVAVSWAECSVLEGPPFHGENEEEMRECASRFIDPSEYALTVDGVAIADLGNYRTDSPLYTIWYPENNLFGVEGPGTTESVVDGIFVMLTPPSAGQHTIGIHTVYHYPAEEYTSDVTYNLTVGK